MGERQKRADSSKSGSAAIRATLKWQGAWFRVEEDSVAVEEPLEIRLGGRRLTVTMRTPGHDQELAAGFLLAEGVVESQDDIEEIRSVRDRKGAPEANIIDVILKVPADSLRARLKRNFAVSSSCGLCGKTTIESIRRRVPVVEDAQRLSVAVVRELAPRLREAQQIFATTGGLHAAALFDREGHVRVSREDIGRHNAVDKVLGWALGHDLVPARGSVLMVSGRSSFEIVQKAGAAGVAIVAAVSAPSSLAVELAEQLGITLIGFLREESFNVYSHPERVAG